MAKFTNYWRQVLIAVAFIAVAVAPFEARVFAQGDGDRGADGQGERGQRRERDGRRGGGPGGDRQRDREGGRNRDNGNNDRPAEARPATPAANPSATSFGTVSDAERVRQSATDTIKKNDKDGNGILEGDELGELGMSRGADKDGDGKITHNELVEFRMPKSTATAAGPAVSKTASSATTETKSPAEGSAKRLIVNKTRKSYRFKSTKDRNDNWKFSSKDANADGQVSMSEYSSAWTDRTATEFLRYDKDNDGMITVEEAK